MQVCVFLSPACTTHGPPQHKRQPCLSPTPLSNTGDGGHTAWQCLPSHRSSSPAGVAHSRSLPVLAASGVCSLWATSPAQPVLCCLATWETQRAAACVLVMGIPTVSTAATAQQQAAAQHITAHKRRTKQHQELHGCVPSSFAITLQRQRLHDAAAAAFAGCSALCALGSA